MTTETIELQAKLFLRNCSGRVENQGIRQTSKQIQQEAGMESRVQNSGNQAEQEKNTG